MLRYPLPLTSSGTQMNHQRQSMAILLPAQQSWGIAMSNKTPGMDAFSALQLSALLQAWTQLLRCYQETQYHSIISSLSASLKDITYEIHIW